MSEPHWNTVKEYVDITYKKADGVARIAINRPEVRNAFRPETLLELQEAFKDAGEDTEIGVVLFTGEGPSEDGVHAFCSGGDQKVEGMQDMSVEMGCLGLMCWSYSAICVVCPNRSFAWYRDSP